MSAKNALSSTARLKMHCHAGRSMIESEAKDQAKSRDLLFAVPGKLLSHSRPRHFSTSTFRKKSAAASGKTVLINLPDPNSNPVTRV
jgi:hypothetical protein